MMLSRLAVLLFSSVLHDDLVSSFQFSKAFQRSLMQPTNQRPLLKKLKSTETLSDVKDDMTNTLAESQTDARIQGPIRRMRFVGTKSVSTDPVPLPIGGIAALDDFFVSEIHRNLLFFRNEVTTVSHPTKENMRETKIECKEERGIKRNDEQILGITTSLQMPGLRVISETIVAAKLLRSDGSGNNQVYPEYQFTVVDTKLKPEGSAPLLWVFNKLTEYIVGTTSFTRVRAQNAGGVNCDKIIFTTEATLETCIHLPSAIARVLPVNVSKFEKQGSRSVQKLLEKELAPALNCFCDAYLRWIS